MWMKHSHNHLCIPIGTNMSGKIDLPADGKDILPSIKFRNKQRGLSMKYNLRTANGKSKGAEPIVALQHPIISHIRLQQLARTKENYICLPHTLFIGIGFFILFSQILKDFSIVREIF